jgi:hypothetical protein
MNKLKADPVQSDGSTETDQVADRMVARVRLLMIISGITTLIAIGAVVSVVSYRVYRAGGNNAVPVVEGTIVLPKGARVVASSVAADRVIVTLDIAGATEIRSYDLKTLKETGQIRFATEP